MTRSEARYFVGPEFKELLRLYKEAGVYVDSLPYSEEIEQIASQLTSIVRRTITEREVYRLLVQARKSTNSAQLIKGIIKRKRADHPGWYSSQLGFVGLLYEGLSQHPESGQRLASDELPYSEEFSCMHQTFICASGIPATRREFYGAIMFYRKGHEDSVAGRTRRSLAEYKLKLSARRIGAHDTKMLF